MYWVTNNGKQFLKLGICFVFLVAGLGKTLQAIALIVSNPPNGTSYGPPKEHKFCNDYDDSEDDDDDVTAKATLIVRHPKTI